MPKKTSAIALVFIPSLLLGCAITRNASDWAGSPGSAVDRDFIECQEKAYKIVGPSPSWGGSPYYTWANEKESIVESCMKSRDYKLR